MKPQPNSVCVGSGKVRSLLSGKENSVLSPLSDLFTIRVACKRLELLIDSAKAAVGFAFSDLLSEIKEKCEALESIGKIHQEQEISLDVKSAEKLGQIGSLSETLGHSTAKQLLQKVIQSSIDIDTNIIKEVVKPKQKNRESERRKHKKHGGLYTEPYKLILIAAPTLTPYCCCHKRKSRTKDSHEFSVAQEEKNVRAKDAFGIKDDFVPGSSMKGRFATDSMPKEEKMEGPNADAPIIPVPEKKEKPEKEKAKKRKKSHKRSKRSSSSSSSASSEEESHRAKKRKKDKKSKKSKKSHRHRKDSSGKRTLKHSKYLSDDEEVDGNSNIRKPTAISSTLHCCITVASSESSTDSDNSPQHLMENGNDSGPQYSLSIVDFSGHHEYYPSLSAVQKVNGKSSPVEAIQRACLPLVSSVLSKELSGSNGKSKNYNFSPVSRSTSGDSKYSSKSRSHSPFSNSSSRSQSRTSSAFHSHRSDSRSSRSRSKSRKKSHSKSKTRSISSHSRSKSRSNSSSISRSSRSRSRSNSSQSSESSVHSSSRSSQSGSARSYLKSASKSPKSDRSRKSRSPSIPRRRGHSPSFMERRRITRSSSDSD